MKTFKTIGAVSAGDEFNRFFLFRTIFAYLYIIWAHNIIFSIINYIVRTRVGAFTVASFKNYNCIPCLHSAHNIIYVTRPHCDWQYNMQYNNYTMSGIHLQSDGYLKKKLGRTYSLVRYDPPLNATYQKTVRMQYLCCVEQRICWTTD